MSVSSFSILSSQGVPSSVEVRVKQSEAIVLRTYPFREADLLVTLFTRAEGKLRGVARSAKKSKKRFGGALEPLTHVRLYYQDKGGRELAHLDSCEILDSPLTARMDYAREVALVHVAEMLDELLPDREANDTVFRLALSVLAQLRDPAIWMALTYFDLWMGRLTGVLPEMGECIVCGAQLNGSRAFYHALADGLMCASDKRLASSEMSSESRKLAVAMFRSPVDAFAGEPWPRQRAADLRKFLAQMFERHVEKKLVTNSMLDRLE